MCSGPDCEFLLFKNESWTSFILQFIIRYFLSRVLVQLERHPLLGLSAVLQSQETSTNLSIRYIYHHDFEMSWKLTKSLRTSPFFFSFLFLFLFLPYILLLVPLPLSLYSLLPIQIFQASFVLFYPIVNFHITTHSIYVLLAVGCHGMENTCKYHVLASTSSRLCRI